MNDASALPVEVAPTRTPGFEKRLAKRYAAEKRFRFIGLAAIVFSIAVLVFLLGTMIGNGLGGFQRAELRVPIDFAEAGLTLDPSVGSEGEAVRSLEAQGLPGAVDYFAEKALGQGGAQQLGTQAWRDVAAAIYDDPAILGRKQTLSLIHI